MVEALLNVAGGAVGVCSPPLVEQCAQLGGARTHLMQARSCHHRVRARDELHQDLPAIELNRIGHGNTGLVEPLEAGPLRLSPEAGFDGTAEVGLGGDGSGVATVADAPSFCEGGVAAEEPMVGGSIALRREQTGLIGIAGNRTSDEEDVCFLAGLQDAKIGDGAWALVRSVGDDEKHAS